MKGPSGNLSELPPVLPLEQCLAKSYPDDQGNILPGRDVLTHCLIVGQVARELVRRLPAWLVKELFPPGSELVAAAHDVGKICPTFQKRIHDAVGDTLPGLARINPDLESGWMGHPGVSQAATKKIGDYIPEILGRHHGSSPQLGFYDANSPVFGGEAWQNQRLELVEALKQVLHADWPQIENDVQASVLSGLTTVADWIGSGSLFDLPAEPWLPLVTRALDQSGFLSIDVRKNLSFREIFGFDPRPVQRRLIEVCDRQGAFVLEAPMGLGKTEAALFAAYRALESGRARGIYFALPTQLTSNKIHSRMNQFLDKILESDQPFRTSLLVHGAAELVGFEIGEEGNPGGSWFQSTKRGLLAPFAVGTIDQALMAVMNVRHGFVRAFGLAGKVVILDEVHSYDSYTGTLLDNLVKAMVEIHCTVIILSATLTRERKSIFMGKSTSVNDTEAYPLVSALPRKGTLEILDTEPMADVDVSLKFLSADDVAMEEALARAEGGQQVLWVENTVAEAQERYKTFASRTAGWGVECGLVHSRFQKCDRQRNEDLWVELYGIAGQASRSLTGRILVGTQVVEQSIDIDADFLVTRLCPTDMLLQRMGRLWRHDNIRPADAKREAWILSCTTEEAVANPESMLGKTMYVYDPYILCRTLEVWESLETVKIPGQIRSLLESTYIERLETGVMARFKQELESKRQKLRGLALVGLSQCGITLPEQAATRYSETDSVEVLLLRKFREQTNGITVTFTDGESLSLPAVPWAKGQPEWRRTANILLSHTVSVSVSTAPPAMPEKVLGWLKKYVYLEDSFRVALVEADGSVVPFQGEGGLGSFTANYDSKIGYQVQK